MTYDRFVSSLQHIERLGIAFLSDDHEKKGGAELIIDFVKSCEHLVEEVKANGVDSEEEK